MHLRHRLSILALGLVVLPSIAWGKERWVCQLAGVDGSAARVVMKLRPDGFGGLPGGLQCFPVIGRCAAQRGHVDWAVHTDGSVDLTARFASGIGCGASGFTNGLSLGSEAAGDYVCETPAGVLVSGGTFDCTRRR